MPLPDKCKKADLNVSLQVIIKQKWAGFNQYLGSL